MLQTFNLPGKNISPDKQMSMMRTYLNQLKDEIESELYNIKWENLAKDLQDMINSLKSYSVESDEKINAINANFVSTDYLAANYATIGSLNAVSAEIGSLAAIAITTQNLSAQTIQGSQITGLTINANQITSGKIKANQIDADDMASNAFSTKTIKSGNIENTQWIHTRDIVVNHYDWQGTVASVKDVNGNTVTVPTVIYSP